MLIGVGKLFIPLPGQFFLTPAFYILPALGIIPLWWEKFL